MKFLKPTCAKILTTAAITLCFVPLSYVNECAQGFGGICRIVLYALPLILYLFRDPSDTLGPGNVTNFSHIMTYLVLLLEIFLIYTLTSIIFEAVRKYVLSKESQKKQKGKTEENSQWGNMFLIGIIIFALFVFWNVVFGTYPFTLFLITHMWGL